MLQLITGKLFGHGQIEELERGELGGESDHPEMTDVRGKVTTAEEDARDEVWAGYRYLVSAAGRPSGEGQQEEDGLKVIELGAGHASSGGTLCGRVVAALKAEGLLNESVGAAYLERHWPPALKASGAWPLAGVRQSFLNGTLTRLLDPDTTLRRKVVEFVDKGELGLASGQNPDGSYQRVWFGKLMDPGDVSFDADVFLLTKAKAQALKAPPGRPVEAGTTLEESKPAPPASETEATETVDQPEALPATRLVVVGDIPAEVWNRLGTKVLPKLRSGTDMRIEVRFAVTVGPEAAAGLEAELRQALQDLGLQDRVKVQRG
jgi:hypothetical protein